MLLGGGGASILAGEFHHTGGWVTSSLTDATNDGPAVTLTSATSGIAVIRSTSNGGELRFATWAPGAWSPLGAVAAGVTTRATPAIAGSAPVADVVFQGNDFHHYFAAHLASWAPTAEQVGVSPSFGPSPASIAALGSDVVVAFAGDNHDVYDQLRSGGAWQAAHPHGLGDATLLTPAIVPLGAGSDLLVVYVKQDATVWYQTRIGGTWSTTAQVAGNALTNDPVALTATATGAVLVFRGQNTNLYWLRYTSALPGWNGVAQVGVPTNFGSPSTPSLAPGIDGLDAELVFVDAADGAAKHARLSGSTWSAPAPIGGSGLTHVGIASSP